MSIKIHNGFLLNVRPAEIFEAARTIREEMKKVAIKLLRDATVMLIIAEHDSRKLTGQSKEESFNSIFAPFLEEFNSHEVIFGGIYTLWKNNKVHAIDTMLGHHQEYCKGSMTDSFAYDFNCQIQLHRVHNRVLCRLYADSEAYMEAFKKLPFVSEYNYFDNYDRPEDISEAEWKDRENTWAQIKHPDQDGFTIDCLPHSFCLDLYLMDEVAEFYPEKYMDIDKRANIFVIQMYQDKMNAICARVARGEAGAEDELNSVRADVAKYREEIKKKIGNDSWKDIYNA